MNNELQPAQEEKRAVWAAPLAAILSTISSIVCCLPIGFLAAFGAAGASAVFASLRPWLMVVSGTMLVCLANS